MDTAMIQSVLQSKTLLQAVITGGALAILCAPCSADAGKPKAAMRHEVTAHRKITYHVVPDDPDRSRHQLDVYRPKGKDHWPVLFLLHGGAWVAGGKDD